MDLDHSTRAAMLEAMPRLHGFAMSLCRDREKANDLTQEALLRACANIDKFKAGSNMMAWLVTILRNQHCSNYRRQQREVEDIDGTYAGTLVSQPEQITRVEYAELCAALAELPHGMRRCLILVGVDGLSYEEAAKACKCSVGTVKSRVHRARARLAATLSIGEPEDPYGELGRSVVVGAQLYHSDRLVAQSGAEVFIAAAAD